MNRRRSDKKEVSHSELIRIAKFVLIVYGVAGVAVTVALACLIYKSTLV